jgi:hypothetical protein
VRLAFPVKRLASLPSETPEDSLMSDVLPSIIVLAMTTLLVFRRELTTPRAKKGPRAQAPQDPAKRAKLQDEIADTVRGIMRCPWPRLASDTSIRPNFAFHRVGDGSTVK